MATSSVILDIRANTNRALADFKRFSAQLDNKFLISGLKLDVVRSALGQINREFQKAIGEQGLTAGQSLRAAQNQASLLLQTFKGFGDEASASIVESFSSSFNQIAVTAGGTFDDVKKALAATPWISADLPEDVRKKLGEGILTFQRDAKRAGLTEDFGSIAAKFLAGEINAGNLLQSGNALERNLGLKLQQAGGTPSTIPNALDRSQVFFDVISDPAYVKQVEKAAKGAAGFRIILEDLNSTLFNPEAGIFGAVKKVTMAVGDTTTLLDETEKLIESIFGKQGTFVLFFEQIKKIFGLEDPLKTVITGIRWLTRQFNRLNTFLQSPQVQQIVGILRTAFTNIQNFVTKVSDTITSLEDPESEINKANKKIEKFFENLKENINKELENKDSILSRIKNIGTSIGEFFKAIEDTIKAGDWDPSKISQSIRGIGKSIRDFINKIGEEIRSIDVDKQGNFFLEIFKTIVGEVAQTLGTAINEAILTIFSGKGLAVLGGVISVLYEGLSKFFTGLFGGNQLLGGLAGGLATGAVTLAFGKKIALALGGLASRIVKAVPGAGLLIRPISGALRALGGRIATQLRKIPGIKRLVPNETGPTSTLGTAQSFQRQVIHYLQQIANCICGPGGLGNRGGPDLDNRGGPDLDRPRNDRLGRKQVSDLGYSGPRRRVEPPRRGFRGTTGKRARIGQFAGGLRNRIRGFGSGIAEFGRNIYTDVTSSGFDAAGYPIDRGDRGFRGTTGKRARIGQFAGGLRNRILDSVTSNDDRDRGDRGFRGTTGKRARIGQFAGGLRNRIRGFGSGVAEFGRNIYTDVTSSGFDAAGYPIDDDRDSFDIDFPEAYSDADDNDGFDIDFPEADSDARDRRRNRRRRRRSTREFSRGFRGTTGKRARISRGIGKIGRGIGKFGKGALIAGGVTAILSAGGAFAGQQPQGEFDPATDSFGEYDPATDSFYDPATDSAIEPQQPAQKQMGGGEAFGAIGAKAGEFATIGSFLGPKGAAIGAVIGAGVALFDKGVREGAIKAIENWAKSVGDNAKKIWDGLMSNVMETFEGIKKWAGSIDWKNILLDTFLPGRGVIRTVAEAAGLQASGNNTGIGSGIKDLAANILGVKEAGSRPAAAEPAAAEPAAAATGGNRRGAARAAGGNVYEGQSYLVGERGIEWFTPTTNGNITNNAILNNLSSRASSPTSTSATFNITINVNGNMGAGNVEELRGPVLAIIKQAWEEASTGIATRGPVI